MIRPIFACLLLATAWGCEPSSQNHDNTADAEPAIRAVTADWVSAYERADVDTLVNMYEEGAMYAANTGEVLEGRDGIRDGIRGWIAQRPAGIEVQLEVQPLRFVSRGDSAHSVERFVVRAMPAGCKIDAGHALIAWHRQSGGNWLIETQLVNRDPQPPPDACARQAIVPDEESLGKLRSHPAYSDGPVVFVNLLDFGSTEAQAKYMKEYALPALQLVSGHGGSLLWAGPIDQQLVGYTGGEWDYAAFVRWPSRAAFVSMMESDEYRALHNVRQETLRSTSIMVASETEAPTP